MTAVDAMKERILSSHRLSLNEADLKLLEAQLGVLIQYAQDPTLPAPKLDDDVDEK